ncbi:MAG: carboxymuconolactone decarboxylase family protein, partial [Pseudomonadota bacterium]
MSKTPFNPFEEMMKMGQEWSNELSKAMAPAMESMTPDALEKLWPTMPAELMETFLGRGLNP